MADTSSITSNSTTAPSTLSSDSTTTLVRSKENPVKGFIKGLLKPERGEKAFDQANDDNKGQAAQSKSSSSSKPVTDDLSSDAKFAQTASKSGWSSATATKPSLG